MIRNYIKLAWRKFMTQRAYAAINILGLTLGTTCAMLIFCLVRYHLSFDDFHRDQSRIYRIVTEKHRDDISYDASVPPALGKAFREDYTFGEKVARECTFDNVLISLHAGTKLIKFQEPAGIAFVEEDYFDIFNFKSIEGSLHDALVSPYRAIISLRLARKYFGEESAIGKTFTLDNNLEFTVAAILEDKPANTDRRAEIYTSFLGLRAYNEWLAGDDSWSGISSQMQCFVKLRNGITVAQVEKELPQYVTKFRADNRNVHVYRLQPLSDIHFDSRYDGVIEKNTIWVLALIGLFLIIIACFNFINLATAQALNRAKEVGVRKVLGSLRKEIALQFIAETGLITFISISLGLLTAYLILPFFNHLFSVELNAELFLQSEFLFFLLTLFIFLTLLAALYPAYILAGFKPIAALKGRITPYQVGGFNTRRSLLIAQFVIAQVLVFGMIVIKNQLKFARESNLGFDKESIVMIRSGFEDGQSGTLVNEFKKIPGIEKISICGSAPASMRSWGTMIRVGSKTENEIFRVSIKGGDAAYLPTFDLKLVAGKNIFQSDSAKGCLVNEMMATKLNLADPGVLLGQSLQFNGQSLPVVGVVKDFYNNSFHEHIEPVIIAALPELRNFYAIKLNKSNVSQTLSSLEKVWTAAYPDQIFSYDFLDDRIAEFYTTETSLSDLITLFSGIAIFISCLGLFGLVSFMVVHKTKEIGIRKILGGKVSEIIVLFGKEFSKLVVISFVLAAPLGWLLMNRWLQDFEYKTPIGISVFVWTILGTMSVAMLTVSFKTIKAAVANPIASIRTE